ncbi:DUF4184 family protein [Pontibacter toksunensis]|uniref:DUF4184 family protein n=1 Tax=Pontibacter toksunensis TaxID=1332631 RepID=A0ABW6BWF9_9BACT
MPFTFSHPAVVLPFKYFPDRWRSMTGLIIGSMAPDFEKFIRMSAHDSFSHTWRSIFYFNLPLSLVLAFLFHIVVRDVLIDHLPAYFQKRLIRFRGFDWVSHFRNHYLVIILSIIIGTLSHIAWDAFTHMDGRVVRWLPFLKAYLSVGEFRMKIFAFLQLSNSVLGLLVVLYAYYLLPVLPVKSQKVRTSEKLRYWISFTLVGCAIGILRYVFGHHLSYLINFIVVSISAGLLSLAITSSLFKQRSYLQH